MANYINFTKAIFNPYNPKVLNEGQFSWMTYDTDKQIGSERENTIDVYMYDNEGNQWYEKGYEGYGEFGNMDYYELLAKMNGFTAEDLEDKVLLKSIRAMSKAEMRDIGIALAFDPKGKKIKTRAEGGKVLFPALVEDPKFNWKRHDFTKEAESDPNQSWYQEPEYDDYDDDDDYEQGWYENVQPTHEGVMSDIHQMIGNHKSFDSFEKEFFKEYGHKKVMKRTPEFLEWLKALYNDYEYAAAESVVTESEAENILDDLLDERGGDMGELHGMEMEDALDTVEAYGHKGSKAKKIAQELHSLCNESVVTEAKFVKEFDKGVLDAEYKADITTYYPSAKFFIGKHSHFFGELEPNLYFKAYYAKYYKEDTGKKIDGDFKITSIYSEKGSRYVNLYVESADTVEAPEVNEARSINKISKELEKTVLGMKDTVDEWKVAEGTRKSELLEKLRELNKEKAKLETELNDAVAGKDHDLQLALTEAEELAYLELDVLNILND